MPLLNRYGFIVFNKTGPEHYDLLDLPPSGFNPLCAAVLLVPGETYKFYVPFSGSISIDSGIVSLVNGDNLSTALVSIGGLAQVDAGTEKHYKIELRVPLVSNLRNGYYRLSLDGVGGRLFSNRLWFNKTDYASKSAVFSFRNRRPVGPIAWDVPEMETFRNVLRLKCSFGRTDTETNLEEYERQTTGEKITTKIKSHHFIPVSTGITDELGAEGWRTLTMHKDILINNRPFSIKTGYVNGEGANNLGKGTLELWDSRYSVVNRC